MDELREDKNWQTYYISPSTSIKCLAASRSSYCPRPLSSYTEVLSSSGIRHLQMVSTRCDLSCCGDPWVG